MAPENLTLIKFYSLSILFRQQKLTDFNFTEVPNTTMIVARLAFCKNQFMDFNFMVLPVANRKIKFHTYIDPNGYS